MSMKNVAELLVETLTLPEWSESMESPATRSTGSPIPFAVAVSRQELSMPPTITLEQMKGLIIDLASTNLFR